MNRQYFGWFLGCCFSTSPILGCYNGVTRHITYTGRLLLLGTLPTVVGWSSIARLHQHQQVASTQSRMPSGHTKWCKKILEFLEFQQNGNYTPRTTTKMNLLRFKRRLACKQNTKMNSLLTILLFIIVSYFFYSQYLQNLWNDKMSDTGKLGN